MLSNMGIAKRLLLLFGLFVSVLIALTTIGLTQLWQVETDYEVVAHEEIDSVQLLGQTRNLMSRLSIYEKLHILHADQEKQAENEAAIRQLREEINQLYADYQKTQLTEQQQRLLTESQTIWTEFLQIHDQVIALSSNNQKDAALQLSVTEGMAKFEELIEVNTRWQAENKRVVDWVAQNAENQAEHAQQVMVLISVISTLVALGLGAVIASSIIRPLSRLGLVAERITAGDLNQQAAVDGSEIGRLAKTFNEMTVNLRNRLQAEHDQRKHLETVVATYVAHLNEIACGKLALRLTVAEGNFGEQDPLITLGQQINQMTASLHHMISQLRDTSTDLTTASAEILSATTQQVAGASEQSAAITQTTTTVSEVKAIAEQSSLRSEEVTQTSQRTVAVSRTGQRAVDETIESMQQIRDRVEGIAANILALSEQTQQIGEIIATVNDIAAQSNMLALNASVEAARAGEYGKGFGVVAIEVRNLAEQSRQATAQIKSILSEIQKATNATVMATEEGSKGVERGVVLAIQAKQSIEQLSQAISEAANSAIQMAVGGQQQVAGIDQVAFAMQNINEVTLQNLASTRQTERAAQNLNELSQQLTQIVAQYQL